MSGYERRCRSLLTDAFVLVGVRTPVRRYGGPLSHVRPDDLLGQTMVHEAYSAQAIRVLSALQPRAT
jgi:hypothetical protein